MTTVLITGATGFIGKALTPFLVNKKLLVRVLSRDKYNEVLSENIQFYCGDITDANSITGIAKEVDIVFHLAGYAHVLHGNSRSVQEIHESTNHIGTINLLNECIKANVKKIIYFSSIKAVADSENCIDETFLDYPNTAYGLAKRRAEEALLAAAKEYNISVTILRLPLVYGPHIKGNLLQMIRAIDIGYFLPIPPVRNFRSFVSVLDVCQAAWLASQSTVANGKIYYVTEEQAYSTHELYRLIKRSLNKSIPKYYLPLRLLIIMAKVGDIIEKLILKQLPLNSDAIRKLFGNLQCSSKRIEQDLGFKAYYNFEMMLPQIVKTYHDEINA